ncbi:MAG TPA: CDP-glucose 4,6-dehydratase [Spirochaetaceae bacterium]|nr:CDP-glucose 4,6-dehydratase [Spirochaetaceae bacterium]HBO41199.1 CDP-glucose 4,6-dehydratase [Spirochaetaceae bacterium]
MIDIAFWKGKKVFLTGHTGFKGSWISILLHKMGAEVTGFSLDPPTNPSIFEQAHVTNLIRDIRGDIRDENALSLALKQSKPDIVLHLAAQAIVRESYINPIETYDINVLGTAKVLQAVRAVDSVRAVVCVTTDKCYENKEWLWGYREGEALGGYDPYSSSKAGAELVSASFRSSFFNLADYGKRHQVALATARAGNVIGGGDYAKDRLIPDIIRAFQRNELVTIRSPESIRPWQHVLEPLHGYLLLAERLYGDSGYNYAEAWNFGPNDNDAKPVLDIVRLMSERWPNSPGYAIEKQSATVHEARYLKLDISKAKERLGWFPKWDLSVALQKVVDWSLAPVERAREITIEQINAFLY